MADMEVPETLSVAIRVILWAVFGFIFALVGWEKLWEGQLVVAGVNGVLLVIATVVAVKWHQIARFIGTQRMTAFYIGLAIACAIGLGFSFGKLMGRTENPTVQSNTTTPSPIDTGRIAWNFEEAARGLTYFLGFNRQGGEEIRISGFVAHGRNTSNDPITSFKGYVRSDITNQQLPIYLIAEDQNAHDFFGSQIPTLPEETFGIPGSADFNITTFNKAVFEGGVDGTPWSKFIRDFGSFTVVLEYDGISVRRQFTKKEIEGQLELFDRQVDPRKNNAPRVTRRPNATPPIQPSFHFPSPPPPTPEQKG